MTRSRHTIRGPPLRIIPPLYVHIGLDRCKNPQQAELWNKIDGSKLRVLASGFEKSTSGPKVCRAIAHHLGINPDTFNVSQAVGDHQSLIVSGLQPALAAQLLAKHGFMVPGALVRFKDFALVVPAYIGTLSGFSQDSSSPEQILATVTAGIREKIASDQGIHALVAKYRELAPLGMSATAIAQFMAKGLWVTPFDIGVSGGDIETAYNIYIHHPSNHPSYYAKLRNALTKHEFSVVTEYNDEGRFLKNLFKGGICFGIDHPTGLCALPHLPGWNGPTPLSLDAQRATSLTARDSGNQQHDGNDGGRHRETRGHCDDHRAPGGHRGRARA
ncbi:hypothetical protein C8J56DRAFT_899232 [Mycena floridula]|nr:hypothetical protein C8J56DRAFT_899232 [Mycena floridula]